MGHIPTARRDGLIVRELADETLVYDLERNKAHCLNRTAALVWRRCNGRLTVEEIATVLADEMQAQVDEQVVWLALSQLRRRNLLSERFSGASHRPRISRRDAIHTFGRTLVIALPLITSIVAPRAAQAASCGNCGMPPTAECCGPGCPCTSDTAAKCCSGICNNGVC
ncbi:MAG: PqqD family protein [Pyrinomonadaceae bacterium]